MIPLACHLRHGGNSASYTCRARRTYRVQCGRCWGGETAAARGGRVGTEGHGTESRPAQPALEHPATSAPKHPGLDVRTTIPSCMCNRADRLEGTTGGSRVRRTASETDGPTATAYNTHTRCRVYERKMPRPMFFSKNTRNRPRTGEL